MTNTNTFSAKTNIETLGEALNETGYVIVKDLIPRKNIDGMKAELRPLLEARGVTKNHDQGVTTRIMNGVFIKSPSAHDFILNPVVLGLADRVLLPNCSCYTLGMSGCYDIGPGTDYQQLHRDDLIYPVAHPHPEFVIHAMCAVTDFTEANGATRVVPGSHRWDESRGPSQAEAISAEMSSGSVLFYLGSTFHGGGKNTTESEFRLGVSSGFCLGWLRQMQNQYYFAPVDVARTLPDKLARLIGYQTHQPYLGLAETNQDMFAVLGRADDDGGRPRGNLVETGDHSHSGIAVNLV